jgi:hypothetical protein
VSTTDTPEPAHDPRVPLFAEAEPPRCPACQAEYFACETDWRGCCVEMRAA